jgi:hypothetical protein
LFVETSTADSATLIVKGGTNGGDGGAIFFRDRSSGGSSRIEVFGNGNLDISGHNDLPRFRAVMVGSIEGDGNVFLGANNLTVGSNNLSTTSSGVIQDGGQNGGIGGSLTKIGSGTGDSCPRRYGAKVQRSTEPQQMVAGDRLELLTLSRTPHWAVFPKIAGIPGSGSPRPWPGKSFLRRRRLEIAVTLEAIVKKLVLEKKSSQARFRHSDLSTAEGCLWCDLRRQAHPN